jgi:dipeptidyl aminopeptidase/acylaminoacyl peptidase
MRRLSSFIFLFSLLFLFSCTSQASPPAVQSAFYVYRFEPSAFIKFSKDFHKVKELPFDVPLHCSVLNTFPAPIGKYILIELNCPNGQTVLFLDTDSSTITQPITDSDSHFLTWRFDGNAAFLRVDSLGNPKVLRVSPEGARELIPNTEFTYDLAASSNQREYIFTFSRGLGRGSELWLARNDGSTVEQLYADQFNYISFARFSPDGSQIAFLKIPDTQIPFTIGELWVMNRDGSNARKLADADAGHGYSSNWSPDGERIAFVVRENPEEPRADQSSEALISNIYIVDVKSGALSQITHLESGRVETPFWSPDGNTLAFNVVMNDRMTVQIVDLGTGEIRSLTTESTCCPAWIRK